MITLVSNIGDRQQQFYSSKYIIRNGGTIVQFWNFFWWYYEHYKVIGSYWCSWAWWNICSYDENMFLQFQTPWWFSLAIVLRMNVSLTNETKLTYYLFIKNKQLIKDNRPTSLRLICAKIWNKVIFHWLVKYLNGILLTSNQSGFCPDYF